MKNLQIDIKIKLQINDTTLELSKEDAEVLYNTLGNALNKFPQISPYISPYTTYPWTTTPIPCGTGNHLQFPPGINNGVTTV